ncbi:hypothetical protein Leryth_021070 [Lithospermum erythrorhizon]|nr:hypothetical protein Leryth_021070 [Lithospermum erythrorhizon]
MADIIGVVQHVSPTVSIRRKIDNEMIPKRDITVADETKKTVVVSLWNDLATNSSQEMMKSRNEECSLRFVKSFYGQPQWLNNRNSKLYCLIPGI